MSGIKTDSGRRLAEKWGVAVRHELYNKDGTWYMPLERFPGAYFDPEGFLLFRTEKEYRESPYLRIGIRVHVPGGISRVPGYSRRGKDPSIGRAMERPDPMLGRGVSEEIVGGGGKDEG